MYTFDSDEQFKAFIAENVLTTGEAADILGCSRQNLSDLIRRGKLRPIKSLERVQLFWKPDLVARTNRSTSE